MFKISVRGKIRIFFWCLVVAIIVYIIADIDRTKKELETQNIKTEAEEIVKNKDIVMSEYGKHIVSERVIAKAKEEEIRLAKIEEDRIIAEKVEKERLAKIEKDKVAKAKKDIIVASNDTPTRSNGVKGRSLGTFQATAYCACTKCCGSGGVGITATGTKVTANRTLAVDPRVIPFGSRVKIEGVGIFVAEDSGSAVKGKIVDIFMNSHQAALKHGRRNVKITVLD